MQKKMKEGDIPLVLRFLSAIDSKSRGISTRLVMLGLMK